MVETAPSSIELQKFQFKLHSKLKIFENTDDSKLKTYFNLVAAASKYGIIFVGSIESKFEVIQLKTIENISVTKNECTNFPRRSIVLPSQPFHLAVNCEQTLLAVVCNKNDCPTTLVYQVPSFLSQNVSILREIRLSTSPGVSIIDTCWNPTVPGVYTACKSDGSLGVYNIQENSVDINELPIAAGARCFSWSPKGKQIVVGSSNGTLTQYKPDLKAVKVIPAPVLTNPGPYSVINICWLTNYQFIAVYHNVSHEENRPTILIVNSPKAGAVNFVNYDDICYSYGSLRGPQYYFIHQQAWGVVLVASANSMEIGVLGVSQSAEPTVWQQWTQIDAARAELPLSVNHQETFPIGIAFDTGITFRLPWGENQNLDPMPMIHILSHHGTFCSFSVINIIEEAAKICTPPEPVADISGIGHFIVQQPVIASSQSTTIQSKSEAKTPQPTISVPSTTPGNGLVKPSTQPTLFSGLQLSQGPLFSTAPKTVPTQSFTSTSNLSFGSQQANLFEKNASATSAQNLSLNNQILSSSAKGVTVGSAASFGGNLMANSAKSTTAGQSFIPSNVSVTTSAALDFKSVSQTTKTQISEQTPTKKEDYNIINDRLILNLIQEELKNFQSELEYLLQHYNNINLEVGTEEEKINLVLKTENFSKFYKELQETTETQKMEIHSLKQALYQSFDWAENVKFRQKRYADPYLENLFKYQELDPVSEKKMADIHHYMFYVEAQLKQVHGFLDNQWNEFQDYCKKNVRKLQIPTLEPIYQSLLRQNAILDRNRYSLKDISARMKLWNKKKSNTIANLIKDRNINEQMQNLRLDQPEIFSIRLEKIATEEKKFTELKQNKLCSFFSNRNVVRISPNKPKFINNLMKKSVQSNLTNFEKLDNTFNDSAAEANFSSSNLFSFSFLDHAHSTKIQNSEKDLTKESSNLSNFEGNKENIPANTNITLNLSSKLPNEENKTPKINITSNLLPVNDANTQKPAITSNLFSANLTSSMFTSIADSAKQKSNITSISENTTQKSNLTSNIVENKIQKPTITSNLYTTNENVSSKESSLIFASTPEFLSQKSNITSNLFSTNEQVTKQKSNTFLSSEENKTIKTTTICNLSSKIEENTAEKTNLTSNLPTSSGFVPIVSTFNFSAALKADTVPQTKDTVVTEIKKIEDKKTEPNSSEIKFSFVPPAPKSGFTTSSSSAITFGAPRDSLDSFNLSNLKLVQQSTPNPKSGVSTTSEQVSPVLTTITTNQIIVPKPVFSTVTIPVSKTEFTAPKTSEIFGNVTGNTAGLLFTQKTENPPNLPVTTSVDVSGSIFGAKTTELNKNIFGGISPVGTTAPATNTGFSFVQTANTITKEPKKDEFSFGNLTVSALAPSTVSTTAITSLSTTVITTNVTTNSIFSGFGANIFDKSSVATTTTASSFLGQPICSPTTFGQQNIFNQNSGNIFGAKTSTTSSGSIFGNQTSVFGSVSSSPVVSTSSSAIFEQSNLFGAISTISSPVVSTSASIFGQSTPFGAPSTTSSSPIVSTSSSSIFGQSTPFGATPTTANPIVSTSSSSIFGQSATFGATPTNSGSIFGQTSNSGSIFGQTSSTGSFSFTQTAAQNTAFGGSAFGAKPSFGQAPAFGQPPSFGTVSPSSGSIFGNSTPGNTSGTFGSGFGSPTNFGQKQAFGSPPAFGQSGFGAPPAFGTSPSFGSPQRVFGSTTSPSTGNFGSPVQENSTFANLANQQTLGFGNLVQNQQTTPQSQPPQFSGGAQFSSWR